MRLDNAARRALARAGMMDDEDLAERTLVSQRRAPQPGAPMRIGHYLALAGEDGLQRIPVGDAGIVIGRHPECGLVLADPEVSRRHCKVAIDHDAALLTDLGSTNGTFLGTRRLDRPVRLRHGGSFRLGSTTIRFERRGAEEVAGEAALEAEIRRAADYVRAILPPPLADGPVQTDWWFVPSSKLGGDAFGYQFLDGEACFTGFVLDVSGHGIGSAMHAANVANAIRRRALPGADFTDPASVAAALNAVFPMEHHNGLMLTLWYFAYHVPSRRLRFCSAGHHPAYLATADGVLPDPLWLRAPAIGMLPRGTWPVGEAEIPPGARLHVFSDGAFEIVTASGRPFQIEDLRELIAARPLPGVSQAEHLYRTVRSTARGPLEDDFSALVFRFP